MNKIKSLTLIQTLILSLTAFSVNALAGWLEIERFDDATRIFVDATTASRTGDTAQVKHLVRWGEPQSDPDLPSYLSTVVLTTYDCANKLEKYTGSTSYSGAMGNGKEVTSDDSEAEKWYTISDASMEEKLWKVACGAP